MPFVKYPPGSGGISGSVGTVDNGVPRANGTGGSTLQGSSVIIDDNGHIEMPLVSGTRLRWGSGNTPSITYDLTGASPNLVLAPGGLVQFAFSALNNFQGREFTTWFSSNSGYENIFTLDGNSTRTVRIKGDNRSATNAYSQDLYIQAGDQTIDSFAEDGANLSLRGGNTNSSNAASTAGHTSLLGGVSTHASNNNPGGNVTIAPGTSAGSGGFGDLILTNIKTATANADTMTMTNGPTGTAGNPTRFIRIVVDGSNYVIPLWPG